MTQGTAQISNADYHSGSEISSSKAKDILKFGPKSYWALHVDKNRPKKEPTAAMKLGTMVHAAVLEPDLFKSTYKVVSSRSTKKGKEEAENVLSQGLEPCTKSDYDLCIKMRDSVHSDLVAKELLTNGVAEKSYFWKDEKTGLNCKCRPDWLNKDIIVDLKTSRSGVSPKEFAKTVVQFQYHLQASWYLSGVQKASKFIFIVVRSEYPYDVATYELDTEALKEGQRLSRDALEQIAECQMLDYWPSWSQDSVQTLSLPRWAFTTPIKK